MCGKGLCVQTDPGQGQLPVGGVSGVEGHLERGSEQGLRRSTPGQHRSIIQRWSRHRYSCVPVSWERWDGVGWGFSMQALVFKGLPCTQEVQWKAKPSK